MAKPFNTNWKDPRGHNLRIYDDVYDSPAFKSLSPIDVVAYLALLRELKKTNNGDLSLTLTRAKTCGISHHMTLARSLRALCAVGLVAVNRKGGCTKGGQKLATLYRVTDIEAYAVSAKLLDYVKVTNEWKLVTSIQHGKDLIAAAELTAKETYSEKISPRHAVTQTMSGRDVVGEKTRSHHDEGGQSLGHGLTQVKNTANPVLARVSEGFRANRENSSHTSRRVLPNALMPYIGDSGRTDGHDDSIQQTIKQAAGPADKKGVYGHRPNTANTTMGQMLRRFQHCRSPHHVAAVARLVTSICQTPS